MALPSRDHNATSYSTETTFLRRAVHPKIAAEIITLRAIALKLFSIFDLPRNFFCRDHNATSYSTETFNVLNHRYKSCRSSRDHNATSYSTETMALVRLVQSTLAEIITLRAIALKQILRTLEASIRRGRDHNATSYSTETLSV